MAIGQCDPSYSIGTGCVSNNSGSLYSYCVLGVLEVWYSGKRVNVPKGNVRTLLAALLLNANSPLTIDMLVQRIWGDKPPKTARAIVHNSVSQLRSLSHANPRTAPLPIATEPEGYSIRIPHGAIDLHRFDRCVTAADVAIADGRRRTAADMLDQALSIWRSSPLPDVTGPGLRRFEIRQLHERWASALYRWAELEIDFGNVDRVVSTLRAAVVTMPTAERLRYQFVRTLVETQQLGEARQSLKETELMLRAVYDLDARPMLDSWWQHLATSVVGESRNDLQVVNSTRPWANYIGG
ncbi:AfsR/SARP family transcriptional regulator [Nocardia carnea]|uniref:AfsR/SARP family transcriptional regulator n=1 Tax=Nocardia carnea TaxID=37328 RepID=UPI002457DF96|nr:bacterial transcriptional activator domain-containing protein [Nocardia carnea]